MRAQQECDLVAPFGRRVGVGDLHGERGVRHRERVQLFGDCGAKTCGCGHAFGGEALGRGIQCLCETRSGRFEFDDPLVIAVELDQSHRAVALQAEHVGEGRAVRADDGGERRT